MDSITLGQDLNLDLDAPEVQQPQSPAKLPFAPFPGTIVIDTKDAALNFARSEYFPYSSSETKGRMVLWTNSSARGSPAGSFGIGIVYKQSPTRWVDLSFHIANTTRSWVAEISAISKALLIAREETARANTKPDVIVVYSPSQGALSRLRRDTIGTIPGHKAHLKPGLYAAQYFDELGIEVELRWVPNHRQIETSARIQGNRLAHSAARKGACFSPSESQTATILSITGKNGKMIRAPIFVS